MNINKKLRTKYALVGIALIVSLFSGCSRNKTKTELSDILKEDAKVTLMYHQDKRFQPIAIGEMISGFYSPETNKITFDGEIDFEVDDIDVYNQFKVGNTAEVSYREIYRIKGTKKTLVGYKFIGAQPKN